MSGRLRLEKKIAEGREAEMFAMEDGNVLRLFRGSVPRAKAEYQIHALQTAREAGVRVPEVYGTLELAGRLGVIIERIEGTDLLAMLGQKPWLIRWIGNVSGRAQGELNGARVPETIPQLIGRYEWLIQHADGIPPAYAEAALARLAELPECDRLLHGDFHPGNVMMQDDRPVIIDWSNAARGSPEADLVRTRMMIELGEPPPGTPAIVRAAALFARSLLRDAHVRAYRRICPLDDALLRLWELPVAVARLAEAAPSERSKLTRFIERRKLLD